MPITKVANGASDLFAEIFGDKGVHSRTALGVVALPRGVAVEIDAIVEVHGAPVATTFQPRDKADDLQRATVDTCSETVGDCARTGMESGSRLRVGAPRDRHVAQHS